MGSGGVAGINRRYFGWFDLPTTMAPASWHAHELLFGYAAAVVAGFMLTTVPNWTGRLPLQGWPAYVWLAAFLSLVCAPMLLRPRVAS